MTSQSLSNFRIELRAAGKKSCRGTELVLLVFQLVARHHLNACDISILACDKVQLIRLMTSKPYFLPYVEHSSNRYFPIHSL